MSVSPMDCSVLAIEKDIARRGAVSMIREARDVRLLAFSVRDCEEVVSVKSSTYERRRPCGMSI